MVIRPKQYRRELNHAHGEFNLALSLLIFTIALPGYVCAAGPLLIAYDGHNETMAPQWICSQRDSSVISPETMVALTKGLVEALVYIQAPTRKREVMEILKKNLRLSKDEDVEASYKVARQQMPSLDVAPNPDVWRLIQRIVSRINPKVQEVDLDQLIVASAVRNLEETGFLPEMRKKFAQ